MSKIKSWISASRPRTLPLSVSGIITGTALANSYGHHDDLIFILALLTTAGFQITSNLANDYGDGVKGTDNEGRIGPKRAYQSGALTKRELRSGILYSVAINFILTMSLLHVSFGKENLLYFVLFGLLGLLCIWAAITYTVGDIAYGYKGLGDVFVFFFFGWLAVMGSLFLYTKSLNLIDVLPATAIGLLCTGVINLNNLRDHQSDKKSNKNTMVVKMGYGAGKSYHTFLMALSFLCLLAFITINYKNYASLLPLLAFIPVFYHVKRVHKVKDPALLDPELKKLALSTFLLSILFYVGFNIFL